MAKYGQSWKEQRRFTLSILRDFGMGKTTLEQQVIEEAGHLCSVFSAEEGLSNLGALGRMLNLKSKQWLRAGVSKLRRGGHIQPATRLFPAHSNLK